jgi:hypothetical protein
MRSNFPNSVSATGKQGLFYQSCKRRKLEHVGMPDREPAQPLPSRFGISSAFSPADSQSSRASSSSPSLSDCSASDVHTPDVQIDQSVPAVPGPRLPPQPTICIPDTVYKISASNLGPPPSPSLLELPSLPRQVQDNPDLQAQSIRSSHVQSTSKRKREADPDDRFSSAIESSSINQQIPGLPRSIPTFNAHTNRVYSRIHVADEREPPKRSTSRDMDPRPRKRLRENQVSPSSILPLEPSTPLPLSILLQERSPVDLSSPAPSDALQAKRRYVDFTAAQSIEDKDVVQPLASALLEQEATSLTTESVDIASWLSSGIESSTTEQDADPLLTEHDPLHADPSATSWSRLYGPEPHLDGGQNYGSPYDASTPGLDPLSPSDTASISSSDAPTPFSIAEPDDGPLPHEIQAKLPSSCRAPNSARVASSLDWEQSSWMP